MTRPHTRVSLGLATGLAMLALTSAPAQAQRCTGFTALTANTGDALCACSSVTQGFLRTVQSKHRFPALLAATSAQCPGLANLLSDLPTAAPASTPGDDGDDDVSEPKVAEPVYEEPVSEEPEETYEGVYDDCGDDDDRRDDVVEQVSATHKAVL